ncbi:MAG: D-alanine--D-alanine ligase [candidate division Zixibacteria bacterium]|nr:D-alanine--D-alanine ligase [candidate division Zixibacteria bacterium]
MKILLLAGGNSSERAVSLNSSAAIFDALKRLGHKVIALDTANGRSLTDSGGKYIGNAQQKGSTELIPSQSSALEFTSVLSAPDTRDVDLVFLGLHGGDGENGSIQALLDLSGKKYIGSGMTASAVAMNKGITKRILISEGIKTPDWLCIKRTKTGFTAKVCEEILNIFTVPIIVKPNDGGSTVGLTKVTDPSQLGASLNLAAAESEYVLIEAYISGRELTVAVLDGTAFPIVEIKPKKGLYDYESKYTKGKTEYIVPAEINKEVTQSIQDSAVKAYTAVGCSGLARIDFILAESGDFYCLEINTLPGMTALSLAPMAAKAVGIGFDELIFRIIESALKK